MQRTTPQNSKYFKLINNLWQQKKVFIWDGRYQELGYPNPMKIRPSAFGELNFRNLIKQLDLEYPKDENGLALSSAKLSKDEMCSHINFLEVLCAEIIGEN